MAFELGCIVAASASIVSDTISIIAILQPSPFSSKLKQEQLIRLTQNPELNLQTPASKRVVGCMNTYAPDVNCYRVSAH